MSSTGFGRSSWVRGSIAGLAGVFMLVLSAFPSRLSIAIRGWGSVFGRVQKALAGTILDIYGIVWVLVPVLVAVTLLIPLVIKAARTAGWQRWGAMTMGFPVGFLVTFLTVTAQEVKSERGSFPTMFDLLEGGTNASFLEGTIGFLLYDRIWKPCVAGLIVTMVFVVFAIVLQLRWSDLVPWKGWGGGLVSGVVLGALGVTGLATLLARENRFTAAALGDPLTGLVESTIDVLQHRGPATPRSLVLDAELPDDQRKVGAGRLGWPPSDPSKPHLYARPLDFEKEPVPADPRGRKLLEALARVSDALFREDEPSVALFQLSLEGFRADDVHALNPAASTEIAPFTSSLYEPKPGVITCRKFFQAGVRTAHCLGAMTCGLGTLPYNLSFIRDLQPFPVRCSSDVLADAGFRNAFFYGSDAHFDEMARFFQGHGFQHLVTQAELPKDLPKGTWEGLTDFAVFDAAVDDVAQALPSGPQFAVVMSLSNHSPFTPPADLPAEVDARVTRSLTTAVNRADADDRLRLITYSYTDAAVERLFARLDAKGIADRSVVVVIADHSTGHAYVWGPTDPETDEAKSQIPFAIVIPPAFLARARDPQALATALAEVQRLIDEAPLSQNDLPSMLLALFSKHPSLKSLPEDKRWHTLGGQVTSPYFDPGGDPTTSVLGINGVSELYALDRQGHRVGGYEDSVFLKTRADRYRVTPRLIPVTATLIEVMKHDAH